jgi:hypothetical protein
MITISKTFSEQTDTTSISSRLLMIFFMKHFVSRPEFEMREKSYLIPTNQLQKSVTIEV